MKKNSIKNLLKDKKVQAIGALGLCVIIAIGISIHMMIKNKDSNNEINKKTIVEKKDENKNKEENNDDESKTKKQLESIKNVDISKLSEEDKKTIENEIKAIEDKINKNEYSGIEGELEKLKNNIDNKLKEVVKVEEKAKEENTQKEVASGSTESNSTEKIQDENIASNNTNNNEVITEKPQPTVTEEKVEVSESEAKNEEPVNTIPEITATPIPQPEIKTETKPVEQPKPVYPSLGEVKQRLINYGQSLGYKYNPSLEYNGFDTFSSGQMKNNDLGGEAQAGLIFTEMEGSDFGITVEERSDGFIWMTLWVK